MIRIGTTIAGAVPPSQSPSFEGHSLVSYRTRLVEYRAHVQMLARLESLDSVKRSGSTLPVGHGREPFVARDRPVVDDRVVRSSPVVSAAGDKSMIPAPKKAAVLLPQEPRPAGNRSP
jgi:hypothetical protein